MVEYLPKLSEGGLRWVRFLGLVAGLAAAIWIALLLRDVLTPLVAALAAAYILNPAVTWLETRHRVRRVTSVSVGLIVLLMVGAVLLLAVGAQAIQLAGRIPGYTTGAVAWVDQRFPDLLDGVRGPASAPAVENGATEITTRPVPRGESLLRFAREHGMSAASSIVTGIGALISNAFYWVSLTVLLPLYTFFFLLEFNQIVATIHDHLPAASRPTIVQIVSTIDHAIAAFFRGRLIVCLIVGTLTGIGWSLCGVPFSLALGALAGTLNLVPFLSVLALPPALVLTYFDIMEAGGNWALPVTCVLGVYMLVQAIESFVLTPLVESKASGLHPVSTVVALLIGNQLAGLLGMLLAIPIAGTLKSLLNAYGMPEIRRLAGQTPSRESSACESAPESAAGATESGAIETQPQPPSTQDSP